MTVEIAGLPATAFVQKVTWDWGNGVTTTTNALASTIHTYQVAGTYSVVAHVAMDNEHGAATTSAQQSIVLTP